MQQLRRLRSCGYLPHRLQGTRHFAISPDDVPQLLLDTDRISIFRRAVGPFAMNQYLIGCKSTKEAAFVDSGEDPDICFSACAAENGFQVKHLLQTHGHIDHVTGLSLSKKKYPKAPVYLCKKELTIYDNVHWMAKMFGMKCELPLPVVDVYVEDGSKVMVGDIVFETLLTPGHTPGHCIYYHSSHGCSFAFVGDLIFEGSVGRTDLPGCDQNLMVDSIRRVAGALPPNTILFPGHMGSTTMGKELASNPFIQMWTSGDV